MREWASPLSHLHNGKNQLGKRTSVSEERNFNQPQVNKEQSAKSIRLSGQKPTISSYTSYWPLAMALALCIVFLGLILNPIILTIGIVLTIAAAIAWGLERR